MVSIFIFLIKVGFGYRNRIKMATNHKKSQGKLNALALLYDTFLLQQLKATSVLSEGRESHGSAPLQNLVSFFLFQYFPVLICG